MTFSLIIPCYNIAPFIARCIDSLVSQTYTNWECLCIIDGATDGVDQVLTDYLRHEPRLKIILQRNGGVGSARNRGVALATGDYVWYIDGDDAIVPNALEMINLRLKGTPAEAITFGNIPTQDTPDMDAVRLFGNEAFRTYDFSVPQDAVAGFYSLVGSLIAWNGVFHRDLASSIRFCGMKNGEDIIFGAEVVCRLTGKLIAWAARPYIHYDRVGSAMYNRPKLPRFRDSIEGARRLLIIVQQWRFFSPAVRPLLQRKVISHVFGYFSQYLSALTKAERRIIWREAFQSLCTPSKGMGLFHHLLQTHSPTIVWLFIIWPWRIKAFFAQSRWIRTLWRKLLRFS